MANSANFGMNANLGIQFLTAIQRIMNDLQCLHESMRRTMLNVWTSCQMWETW